jgi:hypothetical protein
MASKTPQRTGARTVATVDKKVLLALEEGSLETANLTEGLAINMAKLLAAAAPTAPKNATDLDLGIVQRMAQAGKALREVNADLSAHPSDTVRGWAWMAVRAIVVAQPLEAIRVFTPWTRDANVNIRRFASEATRPRGVWAASIPLLRKEPEHARGRCH